jgi:hypothetical protein
MFMIRSGALLATMAFALPAAAQGPVAVVEEVTGPSAGVGFMDYVHAGTVIRLGARDSIVLDYMKSCVREKITGGTIVVGEERSDVRSGTVQRSTVACDAARLTLTSQRADQAAGLVMRSPAPGHSLSEPEITLYGSSPIVVVAGGSGRVVIVRLDAAGERHEAQLGRKPPAHVDFATSRMSLAPGGTYRVVAGTRQLVFKVDAAAKPGHTPAVGRMLRLDPAN